MNDNTLAWVGAASIGGIMASSPVVIGVLHNQPELVGTGVAVGLCLTGFLRTLLGMLE